MSFVELIWATDRFSLYTQLEAENRDDTFAVRQMLWYLISGRIKEGNVYVDRWPSPSHVCCLHPTTLYSVNDRDFATLSSKDPNEVGGFFSALMEERRWQNRDGLIMAYVEEHLAEIINKLLCPDANYGSLWVSKSLRHYTCHELKNFELHAREFGKFYTDLPVGLSVTKVKPEEAHLVAEHWPYDLPDKSDYLKWLIETFPSVCTRDSQGRPVGWVIAYNFGPSGAAYILPEYRGQGIIEAQVGQMLSEVLQISPGQRFFWILDDNIASLRQAYRTIADMRRTNMMTKLVAYTAPKDQKMKARL